MRVMCLVTLCILPAVANVLTGCGTACGPVRKVPPQSLAIVAPSPDIYTIRVNPKYGNPIETSVPKDGRIKFDVLVTSRDSRIICFGIPIYHYPPPDTLRVIFVMQGKRVICKLSAKDIERLPMDVYGYHVLRMENLCNVNK